MVLGPTPRHETYFMLDGNDVHAVGPLGSSTGVIAIRPDGSRELRTVAPGPDSAGLT